MVVYAKLNENKVITGLSQLTSKIQKADMVEIPDYSEDYMYRKYENGSFSSEKYLPAEPQPELAQMDILNDYIIDMDYRLLMIELGF